MSRVMGDPMLVDDLVRLAEVAWQQRDYDQAAQFYEQLAELEPAQRLYQWKLGLAQLLQGNEAEAQFVWAMVLADVPSDDLSTATEQLITVLETEADGQESAGQAEMAWMIRRHLGELVPEYANNWLRLIQLSMAIAQFDGSLLESLQHALGEAPESVSSELLWSVLHHLMMSQPTQPELLEVLKASLPWATSDWTSVLVERATYLAKVANNYTLACRYAELCLQINPHYPLALFRLSTLYQDLQRYDEGIALAKEYFATCQTPLQKVMGNATILRGLMNTGARWDEATTTLQQATQLLNEFVEAPLAPDGVYPEPATLCTALFFYPYLGDQPNQTRPLQNRVAERVQSGIQEFVEQQVKGYTPYPVQPFVPSPGRTKLRIGYLSRFMRMHSVGWLSRWVFQHFDRDRFEVYAYFNRQLTVEPFTQQWFATPATQAYCVDDDFWHIAREIQNDQIDILVDLDSLTSDYTCGVMALKPAPVQMSWLGLDATGLPAIDYFLADPYVLPEDAQSYYAETIWRLPQTYIAVNGFEVGVPTLRRDQLGIPGDAVVYFSAQFAYKRYPETIRAQLQILRNVPNSYFLIKGIGDEQAIQTLFQQLAEEEGVAGDRLRFLPRDANELTHRANLGIADVVLDTYPYNGATTTLETLWMGIPIVTRVGQQFASRNSYTMLINAGIEEGIAHTAEEYVEWGVRLGQDAALRQQIQHKLRQSRHTAPLWNAHQFTRDLEAAYEQMWQRYLDTRN